MAHPVTGWATGSVLYDTTGDLMSGKHALKACSVCDRPTAVHGQIVITGKGVTGKLYLANHVDLEVNKKCRGSGEIVPESWARRNS